MTANTFRGRCRRVQPGRAIAALAAVSLASTTIVFAGAGTAGAAPSPNAQSVGRFADGSIGNMPIQKLADIMDARATAPGSQSVQNPFDITAFNAIKLPLTNVFTIPTAPAVKAGAVNQVAQARTDGSSFGAAGAVANDGGITAGTKTDSFPTVAKVDLSQAALGGAGALPLPSLPGAGSAASLGGITADIGAVSANARTAIGGKVTPEPQYNIAGLDLQLASPAFGKVLMMVGDALNTSSSSIPGASDFTTALKAAGLTFPADCSFSTQVLSPVSVDNGVLTVEPTGGKITISVGKLLKELKLNINTLPANTDLISYVLKYIADPSLLAKGLQNAINDLVNPLQKNFKKCADAIGTGTPLATILTQLTAGLTAGQAQLNDAISMITDPLKNATAGANPLQPLADGLKKVIDIGINVESGPGIQKQQTDAGLKFTTKLKKTPNQNTSVVPNQTLIRALEINVLDTSSVAGASNFRNPAVAAAPSLPGVPGAPGLPTPGAGQTLITLALANAAVGPSAAPVTPPSSSAPAPPTQSVPSNAVPTGVPAGAAGDSNGGSPVLPLVVLLLGLTLAGGGYLSFRMRSKYLP